MCDHARSFFQQQLSVTAPDVGLGRLSPRAIPASLLCALLSALINFSRTKFQLKGVYPVFKIPSGCRDALVQAGAPEDTLKGPLPWGDIWGQLCPMPPKGGFELTPASQSLAQNISAAKPRVSLTVRVKDC